MEKLHQTSTPFPKLFKGINDEDVKKAMFSAFKQHNSVQFKSQDSTIEVSSFPFPHVIIKGFICKDNDEFLELLETDLYALKFNEKSNDLYKFVQSEELILPAENNKFDDKSTVNKPKLIPKHKKLIGKFAHLLKGDFRNWLKDSTEVDINFDVSMFCAQYKQTDVLLCHDDELEGRRFAYVYYLSENWTAKDGGNLDLFTVNEQFEPHLIKKSVLPKYNTFVLFEVSQVSFHQVNEVLSPNKTRLSLSGWFHGPELPRIKCDVSNDFKTFSYTPSRGEDDILSQWVSPQYLSLLTQSNIQEQFEESSEIQLTNFLLKDKFDELLNALRSAGNNIWEEVGPPNRRKYKRIKNTLLSSNKITDINSNEKDSIKVIRDFITLLRSEEMFLYFSNISGLSFHPMAANDSSDEEEVPQKRVKSSQLPPGSNSTCRFEVRCWSSGDYTLVRDNETELGEFALDVNLHLCMQDDWKAEYGGYISYIVQEEDEELLTILPSNNRLSITYRDKEAVRFVKHINCTAPSDFFEIMFVYKE